MSTTIEEIARKMIEYGFSLIPVKFNSKVPALEAWNKFSVNNIEETNDYTLQYLQQNKGNYGIRTGELGKCIVVDLDLHKAPQREIAEQIVEEILATTALAVKTPSGGYHAYYSYDQRFTEWSTAHSIYGWIDLQLENAQVVGPGSCLGYDKDYVLLKEGEIGEMGQELYEFLLKGKQLAEIKHKKSAIEDPRSDALNTILGEVLGNCLWKFKKYDSGLWMASPFTKKCLVHPSIEHSENKHSHLLVTNNKITASCFSHGKQVITGELASAIREVFFPPTVKDGCQTMEEVINKIQMNGAALGLVRRKDGYVWQKDAEIPWLYRRFKTMEEFVQDTLCDERYLKRAPQCLDKVMKYMFSVKDTLVPFKEANRRYLGFRNGVFDFHEYTLIKHDDYLQLKEEIVPRHYIDQEIDLSVEREDGTTPEFDKLLSHQLPETIVPFLMAFIGRLFFRVKEKDQLGLIPMIKGDTGTGKSTLLNVIKAMFASDVVDVLNSNLEDKFGLQTKYYKELLVTFEVTEKMFKNLSADVFKQMACGETISIPVKGKKALAVEWDVPLIVAGNIYPPYRDVRGSISRRLVIFKFDKPVYEKNSLLEQRIIEKELAPIIAKCVHAYHCLMKDIIKEQAFDAVCPPYFVETLDDMKQETDYLHIFLTQGIGENTWSNGGFYFRRVEGKCMPLSDFKKKFKNWLSINHNMKMKWTSDYMPFYQLGYTIHVDNVCKMCRRIPEGGTCCPEYSIANRSQTTMIRHIECVEIKPEPEKSTVVRPIVRLQYT